MSSRFFSTTLKRTQIQLIEFNQFLPYAQFKFRALARNAHYPYPILGMGAHKANNSLHECILTNDIDKLSEEASASPKMLNGVSWGNTPLNLSLKRGNIEATRVIIQAMTECYSEEDCKHIFSERDSMGLLPLSYALFLRVPYDVMEACLTYTSQRAYFTDNVYRLFVEGLKKEESKSAFKITEKGYQLKDKEGGFAIYELSPLTLFMSPMPEKLVVKGDIMPEKDFGIIEVGCKSNRSYYQILRNLLFHVRALCENRGLSLNVPHEEILSSHTELSFDLTQNYPRLARARNASVEKDVKNLVESWDNSGLKKGWVKPSE